MSRLTIQQLDEICAMRERGLSASVIARRYAVSRSTVVWHCLRLGADLPPHRRQRGDNRGPMLRKGRLVRPFTPDEDAIITAMRGAGSTPSDIAKHLERRPNSVVGRLYTLARWEARAEGGQ